MFSVMIRKTLKIFTVLLLSYISLLAADYPNGITYIHPLDDSKWVTRNTCIIVRFEKELGVPNDLQINVFQHSTQKIPGTLTLSTDNRTAIFTPDFPFNYLESVKVIFSSSQFEQDNFEINFETASQSVNELSIENPETTPPFLGKLQNTDDVRVINGVSVPADFPLLKTSINNNPSDGLLFLATERYIILLEQDGTPRFYRTYGSRRIWDFTLQANNMASFMVGATAYVMDENMEIVNQYHAKNGYYTDPHDFRLLENGHKLLIPWEKLQIDLSKYTANGNVNASVHATHIQELDANDNLIFEWRSWDHYNIWDATYESLMASLLHYVHMNSVDVDFDGNLIVSARHLDEVTKIDRDTGEIIWRFGGKNNQFELINDDKWFSYQHDVRAVPGKPNHYTMFDNGNHTFPQVSRAVEFKLDTLNNTAEKVWEFIHPDGYYSSWMGSVDRLENGNTVIGWAYRKLPKITEIDSAGTILFQADFDYLATGYRAHKHVWNGIAKRPHVMFEDVYSNKVTLLFNQFGDSTVQKYLIFADTLANPTRQIATAYQPYVHLDQFKNHKNYFFRVKSVNNQGVESEFSDELTTYISFSDPSSNLIQNGDFEQGDKFWDVYAKNNDDAMFTLDSLGQFQATVFAPSPHPDDISLSQTNIQLLNNKTYQLQFDGYSDKSTFIEIQLLDGEGNDIGRFGTRSIKRANERYSLQFSTENLLDNNVTLKINFAYSEGNYYFDNFQLEEVNETAIQKESEYPNRLIVQQNYPNPFNARTIIQYVLAETSLVEITIYNILGKKIHTETVTLQARGLHEFNFDSSSLPSGLYFYLVKAKPINGKPPCVCLKKMTLLK